MPAIKLIYFLGRPKRSAVLFTPTSLYAVALSSLFLLLLSNHYGILLPNSSVPIVRSPLFKLLFSNEDKLEKMNRTKDTGRKSGKRRRIRNNRTRRRHAISRVTIRARIHRYPEVYAKRTTVVCARDACDDYKANRAICTARSPREIVPARKETRRCYTDRGNS